MTERLYRCYAELWKYNIPQGMDGETMTLREWLMKTGKYDYSFEQASDDAIVDYLKEFRGKYLREA